MIIVKKSFVTNQSLKKHIKIVHEKRKDHVCDACKKGFANKVDLEGHISFVHEGIKKFRCEKSNEICNKAFGSLSNLRQHITNVHDQKRFNQNAHLKTHESKRNAYHVTGA